MNNMDNLIKKDLDEFSKQLIGLRNCFLSEKAMLYRFKTIYFIFNENIELMYKLQPALFEKDKSLIDNFSKKMNEKYNLYFFYKLDYVEEKG